jgi:sulfate transport system permease protein
MAHSLSRHQLVSRSTERTHGWGAHLVTVLALSYLSILVLGPLAVVFASAFRDGIRAYFEALTQPDALSAMWLTLVTALVAVPVNLVFGIAAAWLLSKYDFPLKSLLTTLIDLPFSVSPVVSGLLFVLLLGRHGWFGPFLEGLGVRIIFAWPGIVIATCFITFPIIVRELLSLMQSQGNAEEEAALVLGAGGFTVFFRITLPKIRWALVYGIVLCNARAMGEFGAVSVVSGHIRGETNTLPLHVEVLYDEYQFVGAFAAASVLTLLGLLTLLAKKFLEWRLTHPSLSVTIHQEPNLERKSARP